MMRFRAVRTREGEGEFVMFCDVCSGDVAVVRHAAETPPALSWFVALGELHNRDHCPPPAGAL